MPVKRKFPIVLTLLYHEAVQYTGKTFKEQQVFKVHVELNLSHGIYFCKSRKKRKKRAAGILRTARPYCFSFFFCRHGLLQPGSFMVMLLKLALQPSAKTPICAPSIECVIRLLSALISST